MQFNSYLFVFAFLPIVLVLYFSLNRIGTVAGKILLILSSLVFYAWADWKTLTALVISIAVNFVFAKLIEKHSSKKNLLVLIPIVVNIAILFYYKYLDFTLSNVSMLLGRSYTMRKIALPVGISFFTFQQIAYLVSVSRKELEKADLIDYLAFILYFPKLLMGPLADPAELIGQLNNPALKKFNWENFVCGIKIFSFGLFKKMLLADTFSKAVSYGFNNITVSTSMDWMLIMLFYTFEIYFDFSGYSDMATGASLMLNITLPINFDSPYKALSIRDFWKRWHISLTKFLTKYIYIPLGGSRKGKLLTYVNTMIVFIISGLWHGANWTFLLWGILHGLLMVFDRVFEKQESRVFEPVRWSLSFTAVNVLWLLFRSTSIRQWASLIKRILMFENTSVSEGLLKTFVLPEFKFLSDLFPPLGTAAGMVRGFWMLFFILAAFVICLLPENNYRKLHENSSLTMVFAGLAFVWAVICLSSESVFVYFYF